MGADVSRVLIADSEPALRQKLFSALLALDIFCDVVSSTEDAVTKLAEERYGVLVIDVSLQGGDVEVVIDRIGRMLAADRPVVLVLAQNPAAARTLDVEIVQIVLRKPVNLPQLVDVVHSCVRNARANRGISARSDNDYVVS